MTGVYVTSMHPSDGRTGQEQVCGSKRSAGTGTPPMLIHVRVGHKTGSPMARCRHWMRCRIDATTRHHQQTWQITARWRIQLRGGSPLNWLFTARGYRRSQRAIHDERVRLGTAYSDLAVILTQPAVLPTSLFHRRGSRGSLCGLALIYIPRFVGAVESTLYRLITLSRAVGAILTGCQI